MIQRVDNPQPECSLREELILLPEGVQLWVPIQDTGRHELIEYTDDEGRKHRKDDIV